MRSKTMTAKRQNKSKPADKNGLIKLGKLSSKQKPIKDLSAKDQKQIMGGVPRPDPASGYADAAGGIH